jgi:RHS repeat-associated protein
MRHRNLLLLLSLIALFILPSKTLALEKKSRITIPLSDHIIAEKSDKDLIIRLTNHVGSTSFVHGFMWKPARLLQRVTYLPYGTSDTNAPTDRLYTGQRKLEDTNLYHYGARFYNPELGVFIQPDSVENNANRYAYVHGNPISNADPTGNCVGCLDYKVYGERDNLSPGVNATAVMGDGATYPRRDPLDGITVDAMKKTTMIVAAAFLTPYIGPSIYAGLGDLYGAGQLGIAARSITAGIGACNASANCMNLVDMGAGVSLGSAAPPGFSLTPGGQVLVAENATYDVLEDMSALSALARAHPKMVREDALAKDMATGRDSFTVGEGQWAHDFDDLVTQTKKGSYVMDPNGGARFANGKFLYVQDSSGRIVIGSDEMPRSPHSAFVGGAPAAAAGEITFSGGRISAINLNSGHYRPEPWRLSTVVDKIGSAGVSFTPNAVLKHVFAGYSKMVGSSK